MFKQHLENLHGIENGYLIFSMIVFMAFFAGISIWLFRADKDYINKMKNKPLE